MDSSSSLKQPAWQAPDAAPAGVNLPPLKIFNSLTRSKDLFVPLDTAGRTVKWYICGPTVYDDAHLGHARAYVTSDILRRIMRDYFGYNVKYVMNVTDIDDKIILRGRQHHLLAQAKSKIGEQFVRTAQKALLWSARNQLRLACTDPDPEAIMEYIHTHHPQYINPQTLPPTTDINETKFRTRMKTLLLAIRGVNTMQAALQQHQPDIAAIVEPETMKAIDDTAMVYLDDQHGQTVDTQDHTMFTTLTKEYENRFTEDMRALNVMDPDALTRVSDFVPQIVDFIEKILQNGFAYTTETGVRFDVEAFERAGFPYARLEPWARGDAVKRADGEGELSGEKILQVLVPKGAKSPLDFALWKLSKAGEPYWDSPWGKGRPGWHIECSVMATATLGKQLDIHAGGIDLAFPHHDNELAQSEAYWNSVPERQQWVNYFLHMGHLSISGAKMSKSLKNFVTIRDALRTDAWTARGFRIVLLMGGWHDAMEFTEQIIRSGISWEDKVTNFFVTVRDGLDGNDDAVQQLSELKLNGSSDIARSELLPQSARTGAATVHTATNGDTEYEPLDVALEQTKTRVYGHLCNSFLTANVMIEISEIISVFNTMDPQPSDAATFRLAGWVTSMVNLFGLNGTARPDEWAGIGWEGIQVPKDALPALQAISSLRDQVRSKALSDKGISDTDVKAALDFNASSFTASSPTQPFVYILASFRHSLEKFFGVGDLKKRILALCDSIRNDELFAQGILLEDRANKPSLIRVVTQEMQLERREREEKERERFERANGRAREEAERAAQAAVNPREMFRNEKYSAWDGDGVPTKDDNGEELTKSQAKKLRKEWEKQGKRYEKHLESQAAKVS